MQTQEAIKRIKECMNTPNFQPYLYMNEALNTAIAALEKQIPKNPTDLSKVRDCEGYVGLIGKCPCCGEILEEDTVYCDCG